MKTFALANLFLLLTLGCGPDKATLMETKLDAALRQRLSSIGEEAPPQTLAVTGKCVMSIDADMRQSLIDSGAEVQMMQGDIFTANVSSENVFKVAALDFVAQLQLSKESKMMGK